ncbi:hypothetical protein MNEG_12364, partial [Monoraphidium neglectum]
LRPEALRGSHRCRRGTPRPRPHGHLHHNSRDLLAPRDAEQVARRGASRRGRGRRGGRRGGGGGDAGGDPDECDARDAALVAAGGGLRGDVL